MDIATGSLYHLEGWELEKGDYDLRSYRDRDNNWKKIAFEGMFLDPSDNPGANQSFSLTDYVASIVQNAYTKNNIEPRKYYILFLIPQDCDEIDPCDDFPDQFDSYTAYPESDHKSRATRIFIGRDDRVTDLGRFKTLELLGQSWDDAIENNDNLFIPINPHLSFCESESYEDLTASDDIPSEVISFVDSVARCLIDSPTDRPEWFHELEKAVGAGVMRCAEQAGYSGIDISDLLNAVQESDQPAAQLILARLNTPLPPLERLKSNRDLRQAQHFFQLLVETCRSDPHPDWYKKFWDCDSNEAIVVAAKNAGFSLTIEELAEVLDNAYGEEEEPLASWIYNMMEHNSDA